jgi:hypothetical protein
MYQKKSRKKNCEPFDNVIPDSINFIIYMFFLLIFSTTLISKNPVLVLVRNYGVKEIS